MAQRWSDYLDKLRDGADVVQLYLIRGYVSGEAR